MRWSLTLPALLLMPLPATAQTTTTYNVTSATAQGRSAGPSPSVAWRAFSIPLDQGAEIAWLQVGGNSSCAGGTNNLGFIFIDLTAPNGIVVQEPCAELTAYSLGSTVVDGQCSGPGSMHTEFTGTDADGVPFTGTTDLVLSYYYSSYKYAGCYKTVVSGTMTLTTAPLPPGVCGDGVLNPGEQCDDRNTTSGDGCSAQCTLEACFTCVNQPSVCSPAPASTPCNDGNACTVGETCNGLGVCGGFTSCRVNSTCNICGQMCTQPQPGVCKCG
jgi:cysteine-rich repeat protein